MLAKFVVMAAVVRLQLTLLYYFISSTPSFFIIFLVHIYFMRKEYLVWTSLLKILHKLFNCVSKKRFRWSGNAEPSDGNIAKLWTSTLLEMAKGKIVCQQISFCIA